MPIDRAVLDLTVDPADAYVGVVSWDLNDAMLGSNNVSSSLRILEGGRKRATRGGDDSDSEGAAAIIRVR